MSLTLIVQKLNKNKIFKFTSSVKLAVPLMLILGLCVSYGTVLESNYNSEYAKIMIYNAKWFLGILGLLWINIFNATLSRYPFKKHHIGFVVTHIGLLTLLIGSLLTGFWGVDGQLRITEGQSGSQVVLPRQMLSYQIEGSPSVQSVTFDKTLHIREGSQLEFLNESFGHLFRTEKLIPFAKIEKNYVTQSDNTSDIALSFILKSQFFNVSEWLHSKNSPEIKMGPATIRLIVEDNLAPKAKKSTPKVRVVNNAKKRLPTLVVRDSTTQQILKEIPIDNKVKTETINGVRVQITKTFKRAVVVENKLEENSDPQSDNPALELMVESNGQKKREIAYAKFPNFSLSKDGTFGLKFEFQASSVMPQEMTDHSKVDPSPSTQETPPRIENTIEFHVLKGDATRARIELYKNNEFVGGQWLNSGESFQTPWMGAKITLGTMVLGSQLTTEASLAELSKGMDLPPSAILIRPDSGGEFWLSEGEMNQFTSRGRGVTVYFGREIKELPFSLHLQKFTKLDYPGTETPMSYESDVEIKETGHKQKISMNEPLKHHGYTIYQASYILNPNGPADSIFSVNRDPGRFLKYLGSLILGIGIIIFTLMKSRVWKEISAQKAKS